MTSRASLLLLAVLLASCATPRPQDSQPAEAAGNLVWHEGTGEEQAALSAVGNAEAGRIAFEVCAGCHRDGGTGRANGSYPRLAGQHESVLIKQMADIRAGRRSNPKMEPFSNEHVIGPQEMADIAAYLQSQPVRPDNGTGPGSDLDRGGRLYQEACAECHGNGGLGDAERFFPRLSGQHYQYLLREVRAIRSGERGNANAGMVEAIRPFPDTDLQAVCDFISRLPLP